MILESVYFWLLNKISEKTAFIGDKARTLIILVCFLLIGGLFSLAPQSSHGGLRMAIISLIVLVLAIASSKGKPRPVRWNKLTALSIELFALSVIIALPMHPVGIGYLIFALDILLLFPMLYTIFLNRENQAEYVDLLSYAVIITGIICFVLSVIFALAEVDGIRSGRVSGITTNPNYYGMIGLALVMSGIYNFARERDNVCWEMVTAVSTGIGISMILASVSRTAMLSAVGCAAAFTIFLIRKGRARSGSDDDPEHPFRKRLLVSAAAALLVILSAVAAIKLHQAVFFISEEGDATGAVTCQQISMLPEVYAEDELEEQTDETQSSIKERISTDNDINTFSSGRIGIWERYISRLNLFGNDYNAERKSGLLAGMTESRAHNNFLDYAYRFGIPAGLLYAVFFIGIFVNAVRMALRSRLFSACDMWVVVTAGVYALYAMVEISTLPFTRYMPCLFFISAAPLLGRPQNDDQNDD